MTELRERRRWGEEAEGTWITKGNSFSNYLFPSHAHVEMEKSTSWRTLTTLTPLNIEQRDRKGGEGVVAQ